MHAQPFHGNVSFNAHHSPMGAYFSFTCGHVGTRGGMAAQLGKPAGQDLHIGVKLGGRYEAAQIRSLPFFDGAQARMQDGQQAFTLEKSTGEADSLSAYHPREIRRHYGWATDTWKAISERADGDNDFEFSIFTPFAPIPEPGSAAASAAAMREALLPAVMAELVVDNRKGIAPKTIFFAINFNEGGARILDEGLPAGRVGFAWRSEYGVVAEAVEVLPDGSERPGSETALAPFTIMRWSVQQGLEDKSNPVHLLGSMPGVGIEVPPGRHVILRLALGCYLEGVVTTRLEGRYLYTRHFSGLADVLNAGLDRFPRVKRQAAELDQRLQNSGLNRDQQFLIAHATRSYYGNTQLLEIEEGKGGAGEPYWIVNEGEYCMMNTLDLAVDQMFWELGHNPWVVKNLLDNFVKRYSYTDQVKTSSEISNLKSEIQTAPGGLSFTHDQGVHNQFSPFGTSSYELKDLTGCFSYMTQEQLCNWILIAATYIAKTGDLAWLKQNEKILEACFASMHNRTRRLQSKEIVTSGCEFGTGTAEFLGVMLYDSLLCNIGSEITTYDSLDQSLGQARNNLYIAVKCWAAYRGLGMLFSHLNTTGGFFPLSAVEIPDQLAAVIRGQITPHGFVRAILGGTGDSRILPAIEAILYPLYWKTCPFAQSSSPPAIGFNCLDYTSTDPLLSAFRTHTITLLSDPQRRSHFPDNGIRLSSTSDNSWLSKIALIQHVARQLFNLDENGRERPQISNPKSQISNSGPAASGWEKSDAAHVKWLTEGESAYWAASDQFINGVAKGSRFYPRLITAALWMNE